MPAANEYFSSPTPHSGLDKLYSCLVESEALGRRNHIFYEGER